MTKMILLQGDLENTRRGLEVLNIAQDAIQASLNKVEHEINSNERIYMLMVITTLVGTLITLRTPFWYIGVSWILISLIIIHGIARKTDCLKSDRRTLENAYAFNQHQLFTIRHVIDAECEDVKSAAVVGHVIRDRHNNDFRIN